jgi:hypothetical protein
MHNKALINPAGMHLNVKPLPSTAKSAVPIQLQTCRVNSETALMKYATIYFIPAKSQKLTATMAKAMQEQTTLRATTMKSELRRPMCSHKSASIATERLEQWRNKLTQ